MNRGNLLWGLGGMVVGSIATYFVMEYVHEKELDEYYGVEDELGGFQSEDMGTDEALKNVIAITDAEKYAPMDAEIIEDQEPFDEFLHVVSEEEHMEEDEAVVMGAIFMHEQETEGIIEDEDEEDEDEAEPYTGITIIDVKDVHPGRRIVARFNHENCTLEISSVMSVKTDMFEDVIEERDIEELIGIEGENILMNTEPSHNERMLAVRNNIINLDFAITY